MNEINVSLSASELSNIETALFALAIHHEKESRNPLNPEAFQGVYGDSAKELKELARKVRAQTFEERGVASL